MSDRDLSRRDFIKLAQAGFLVVCSLLGLGGLLRFLDFQEEDPPLTEFDLGPASGFRPGTRTILKQVPAVLLSTSSGFAAFSLTCTHLGCTVGEEVDGFNCPCHGSQFDAEGRLKRGPANKDLRVLRVEVTEDKNLRLFTR